MEITGPGPAHPELGKDLEEVAEVVVQQVEAVADKALHQRYQVEAVPIVVIADDRGVVVDSFLGPVSATHLWAALAEAREPGSVPEGCGGGHDHDDER